ncbi:hypothetical protein PHAVU_009G235400 [Phaseolus vulgaris]|uniref:Uncharacterized protein n=1 Tax=Phaseolus vulgaris TaxID=3885 RepID=V7AZP7_PHAVU|nr:hypothetical protein PHAVU_009G235400g [Phaseolus vulgaris]ESW10760.1 hypothetical protein PHAVU_009G235400g [Phaseolus vulgaris]
MHEEREKKETSFPLKFEEGVPDTNPSLWLAFSSSPQHGFSLQCQTHHFSQEIGLDSTFTLFAPIVIFKTYIPHQTISFCLNILVFTTYTAINSSLFIRFTSSITL